jgi:hypothetical protein
MPKSKKKHACLRRLDFIFNTFHFPSRSEFLLRVCNRAILSCTICRISSARCSTSNASMYAAQSPSPLGRLIHHSSSLAMSSSWTLRAHILPLLYAGEAVSLLCLSSSPIVYSSEAGVPPNTFAYDRGGDVQKDSIPCSVSASTISASREYDSSNCGFHAMTNFCFLLDTLSLR